MSGRNTSSIRQGGRDEPEASPTTFKFKAMKPSEFVNYTPLTINDDGPLAFRYFGGVEPSASATVPDETSQSEDNNATVKGEAQSPSPDQVEDLTSGWESFIQIEMNRGNNAAIAAKLTSFELKLATAGRELLAAQERLSMMHNQSLHASQELAMAARALTPHNSSHHPVLHGAYPFLVHYSSTPLFQKRIVFERDFVRPPRVIVGIQTVEPIAMVLVFASGIDTKGFTIHVDLANRSDLAGRPELLQGLASWIAVNTPQDEELERPVRSGSRMLPPAKRARFAGIDERDY